jgi:LPXTG-motif cell wall-anchored protein
VEPGSTETSALPVNVDQCNGSGKGGGGTVTCTVKVTNNIIPPVEPPPVENPPVANPVAPVTPTPVTPTPVTPTPVTNPVATVTPTLIANPVMTVTPSDTAGPAIQPLASAPLGATVTTTTLALSPVASPITVSTQRSGLGVQAAQAAPSPSLPATGAAIQWQLLLAGTAIVLGGLMLLVSQSQRRTRRQRPITGV